MMSDHTAAASADGEARGHGDAPSERGRRRAERPEPRRGGTARFLRDILIIFLAALLISFLVKTFLVRSFYIPSPSMTNTLQVNDRIVVNELVPRASAIKRGDVVVFTDPGNWLSEGEQAQTTTGNPVVDGLQWALTQVGLGTQDSGNHLIKRVIGLPGDHVACCNAQGQLEVNGTPLTEPYINVPAGKPADPYTFDVTVPAGELWVMGDNRDDSADSAYHYTQTPSTAFVPISDVVGRAVAITWPSSRWGTISDYPQVFARVPKGASS
ncbi:signal peptidase I [Frondihabitans cladoniiphilus]|uniref:Signal peptidase I n=1 Tax=Frondihabitans cladoniiphilus TaxID=715785 RepID=A0ABP8WE90_9MICO